MSDDYAWWDELSPYEQESLMSVLDPYGGMESTNTAVPGYDFADIAAGGGYAPQMGMEDYALTQFGGGLPPELNKYGETMPWGMDQEAQATTLQKNRNSLLVDRAMSMLSGPGAYSASAFDPITVTPSMAGEQALDMRGRRRAESYLGGSGYESFIADLVVNEGMTPSEATTEMWRLVARPDSERASPADRAQRESIIATLPGAAVDALSPPSARGLRQDADLTTPEGRMSVYDTKAIDSFAQDLFGELSSDPTGVWQDPETGQWYGSGPKQMDSAMTKWYKDYGLPTPVETYLDEGGLNLLGAPPESGEEQQGRWDIQEAADLAYQDAIANEREREGILEEITTGRRKGQQAYEQAMERPGVGFGGGLSQRLRAEGAREQATPRVTTRDGMQEIAKPHYGFAVNLLSKLAPEGTEEVFGPPTRRGGRRVDAAEEKRARGNERTAASIRRHFANEQIRAQDRASTPKSRARAEAIGRGMAAQRQGRTPLRDALTQRLLGQRSAGLYGG